MKILKKICYWALYLCVGIGLILFNKMVFDEFDRQCSSLWDED